MPTGHACAIETSCHAAAKNTVSKRNPSPALTGAASRRSSPEVSTVSATTAQTQYAKLTTQRQWIRNIATGPPAR
jgi:hypothetical protein